MDVNKIKIQLPIDDKFINIPIEMKWDFGGRTDSVEEYQEEMVREVIGIPGDFEIVRFSHKEFLNGNTEINYKFHFFNNTVPIINATPANWVVDYTPEGFLDTELYYFTKPFTKSFFKLDFYDTQDEKTQTLYFTIILPIQQGLTQSVILNQIVGNVDVKIPDMILDCIGDKEGYYIYWLRKRDYINLTEFYMKAKFFNGKDGLYKQMTNTPQPNITPNVFNFDTSKYFYYKVVLDYQTKTYEVFDTTTNQRIGSLTSPLMWYEYIDP
jgi:hypothetical protein